MNCFVFCRKKRSPPRSKASTSTSKDSKEESTTVVMDVLGSVQIFSFNELREATQGFRSSNKIGEGGFGSVYKGRLRDDRIVAVKVLSAESRQGDKEFVAEITAMSNVRHENLVKLLGGCHDKNNRIMVYEYMENKSLVQTLLGGEHNRIKFSWKLRRGICIGVAKGIAYLHEEVKPYIVHRDIKSSNILLDKNFSPKISDFGLSKLFPVNDTHISTRVAGTLGYVAPEYAISGHLTRKSDVYSFGVLVLEILSGRCAVDFDLEHGEYCLAEKAWEMYKGGDLLHLIDPILKGDFPETEAILLLKVGLLCVQESPGLRPKMSKAMKMMSNEIDISEIEITQPSIVSDMMKMKIGGTHTTHSPLTQFTSSTSNSQSPKSRFWRSSKTQS